MRVTEAEFQALVLEYAQLFGWRTYHTRDSRGSAAGFPDLVLLRPPRLVLAELKGEGGVVSKSQEQWLDELREVPTLEVHLWQWPDGWKDAQEVLR